MAASSKLIRLKKRFRLHHQPGQGDGAALKPH